MRPWSRVGSSASAETTVYYRAIPQNWVTSGQMSRQIGDKNHLYLVANHYIIALERHNMTNVWKLGDICHWSSGGV